ncbi:MAG: hypothetical protein HRT74_09905 [Flavobacteriales bacterium]|nr:hypothetical protein [Flavobacteriales bacterium]
MKMAVRSGYISTMNEMLEIKSMVSRRVSQEDRNQARQEFLRKKVALNFDEITVTGLEKSQKSYVKGIINKKSNTLSVDQLEGKYFRAFADEKIQSIHPSAKLNTTSNKYKLNLEVKKEKDLFLEVGGIFSSRPINTGYIGLKYNLFGSTSSTLYANSYFGKFYGSVNAGARIDFASSLPFSIEPNLVFNRWDYFTSFATFFEDVQPSFIVINERFGGLKFRFPVKNKSRIELTGDYGIINDEYYQNTQFTAVDTADRTRFILGAVDLTFDRNTLNRKQYAYQGTRVLIKTKYINGEEQTIPGSTSQLKDTTYSNRSWLVAKFRYENFFKRLNKVKFGFMLETVGSTQPFLNNHVSTLISAPAFQPIPEAPTFFINTYRAHNYAAGGLRVIASLAKTIDIRAEGYVFNPLGKLVTNPEGGTMYDWEGNQYYIASGSLVYHSPLGPVSFNVNYYDQKEKPWSVVLNFGYILFNRSIRNI